MFPLPPVMPLKSQDEREEQSRTLVDENAPDALPEPVDRKST